MPKKSFFGLLMLLNELTARYYVTVIDDVSVFQCFWHLKCYASVSEFYVVLNNSYRFLILSMMICWINIQTIFHDRSAVLFSLNI